MDVSVTLIFSSSYRLSAMFFHSVCTHCKSTLFHTTLFFPLSAVVCVLRSPGHAGPLHESDEVLQGAGLSGGSEADTERQREGGGSQGWERGAGETGKRVSSLHTAIKLEGFAI